MTLAEGLAVGECLKWTKYYVRIRNSKVDSYGNEHFTNSIILNSPLFFSPIKNFNDSFDSRISR